MLSKHLVHLTLRTIFGTMRRFVDCKGLEKKQPSSEVVLRCQGSVLGCKAFVARVSRTCGGYICSSVKLFVDVYRASVESMHAWCVS